MKTDLFKTNGSSPPSIPTMDAVVQTAATLPNPRDTVARALEDPAIREAIQRGARKAQVKKFSVVTKHGRHGVWEHTSDAVHATYVALLDNYANEYIVLTRDERPRFVEDLAARIAGREVHRMKREVPLAEPSDGDQAGSEGPRVFACDDISLNRRKRHPSWMSAHAFESELIERIDSQRAGTPAEEQTETKYERIRRLLGAQKADWMLDYENGRYDFAKTSAERVRYCRLRKRLYGM
jgi:hypothetical protein